MEMNRRGISLEGDVLARRESWARWILPALFLSLLLHGLFWFWSNKTLISQATDSPVEENKPRVFRVERVDVKAQVNQTPREQTPRPISTPVPISLPEEKISLEKNPGVTGGMKAPPKIDNTILSEKPGIIPPLPVTSNKAIADLPQIKDPTTDETLRDMPVVSSPSAAMPALAPAITDISRKSGTGSSHGFSDLDKLLAQTGPLSAETAPIMMPGDVLFDYDASALQQGAVESLEKLGRLLKRNPRSRFIIEGHTDSFGPDDYNLRLSEQRAQSVKDWLVANMGIPADSIETHGFGKSRLIVPASASIPDQRINRRVEIVIRPPAS
jgi:outer membrane protein OmpA-like peptidoglycan-associated protein